MQGHRPLVNAIPPSSFPGLCVTVMTWSELIFNLGEAKWVSRRQCHKLPALVL